jgi:hypothetical protein
MNFAEMTGAKQANFDHEVAMGAALGAGRKQAGAKAQVN